MAYDIRFDVTQTGADSIDQIAAKMAVMKAQVQATGVELNRSAKNLADANRQVAEATAAGHTALAQSLQKAADAERSTLDALIAKQRQLKESLAEITKGTEDTSAATQKMGRIMDIAYGQNRARDAKALADEVKRTAAAAAEAEGANNRLGSGLLQLGTGSGIVNGQIGALARGAGTLAGGLGAIVNPATIAASTLLIVGREAIALVKAYAEAAQETDNFARRIGVTVGQARQLQQVGQLAGVSVETLAGSSRYLANALEDSEGAGKRTAAALERLGVSTTALNGGAREEGQVLLDVIEALSKIPDQAERVREGNAALGRGAKEILPLVEQYRDLKDILTGYGISVDENAIRKGVEAEQQFKALSIALGQLRDEIGKGLAPIVITFIAKGLPILSAYFRAYGPIVRGEVGAIKDAYRFLTNPFADVTGDIPDAEELQDKELRGGKGRGGLNNLKAATTPDFAGITTQFNAARATELLDSIDDQDDKTGLSAARRKLSQARARLTKDASTAKGETPTDPSTVASDIGAVQSANEQVRAIEARIEATKKAKLEDKETITLRAQLAAVEAGELTGLEAINVRHDAAIEKLREEGRLNKINAGIVNQIAEEEKRRYLQTLSISRAQNQRAISARVFSEVRRLDTTRASGTAAIAIARGRESGQDEDGIEEAYRGRLSDANLQFQDAARQVSELRRQRDERQSVRPDQKQLEADNRGITEAEISAAGAAALALYEAQKQRELELIALGKKRFEDEASHARNLKTIEDASTRADVEDRRAGLRRNSALIGAQAAGPGQELDILRKQIDLRREAAAIDRDERQRNIDSERSLQQGILAQNPSRAREVEAELARLRAEEIQNQRGYERELGDERIEIELKVAEIRKKQLEEFRGVIGGLFNSIASRQPNAIPNFVKSQVLGQAQKITENAAATYLFPTIAKAGQAVSQNIGLPPALTAGTWLGGSKESPIARPVSIFDLATRKFSDAVERFSVPRGDTGSGGSASGYDTTYDDSGNPVSGGVSNFPGAGAVAATLSPLAALAKSDSGGGGGVLGGLTKGLFGGGNFSAGLSSVLSGNALSILLGQNTSGPTTTSAQIGAGAGIVGGVLSGGYGVYSGLKQGGVGGDLKAAGSAAGLAGGIVSNVSKLLDVASPLLSAIPIVGSIAALALPLIGGLFNGPQRRANQINQELSANQYQAPTALNVTEGSNGGFEDVDARGNIRSSALSPFPQTTNPYLWEQTHGLFGGPPTYYQVPGSQTSQFGAGAPPQPHVEITIHANDSASFVDMANRNAGGLADAIGKHVEDTGPVSRLGAAIQFMTNG